MIDAYIIHVYRRDSQKSGEVVGTLRIVAADALYRFTSVEELWQILKPAIATPGHTRSATKPETSQKESQ